MSEIQVALTTGIFIVALVNLVVILVDKLNNKK
ncbi:putative holin-like toxin [Lentibacillus sp.]